jgi:hypothetical protein
MGGAMAYLDELKDLQPDEGGSVLKFTRPGDAVVARFVSRERVKTKIRENSTRLSIEVVETNIEGIEPGLAVIFESTDITEIMEREKLTPGQGFALKLCEIKRSRYKRFAFKRMPKLDNCPIAGNGEPPDWLNNHDPIEEHEPGSDG